MTGFKQLSPRRLVLGAVTLGIGVLVASSAGIFGSTDDAQAFPNMPGAIGAAVTTEEDDGGDADGGHGGGHGEASEPNSFEATANSFSSAGTSGSRGVDIIPGGLSVPSSRASAETDISNGGTFFTASIQQLNGNHTFIPAVGTFTFKIVGDALVVDGNMSGVAPRMAHAQHIHSGTVCPTSAAEVNGDGVIDVLEGAPAYGPILISLDSDLSDPAVNAFPVADSRGHYSYHEVVNINELIRAHTGVDPNPADAFGFLAPGETLNITNRHVVVHGTNKPLPDSAASIGGLPNEGTLPIGCGEIIR